MGVSTVLLVAASLVALFLGARRVWTGQGSSLLLQVLGVAVVGLVVFAWASAGPPRVELGLGELILLGLVALVVVGPERLPEPTRRLGRLYMRLRRWLGGLVPDREDDRHVRALEHVLAFTLAVLVGVVLLALLRA